MRAGSSDEESLARRGDRDLRLVGPPGAELVRVLVIDPEGFGRTADLLACQERLRCEVEQCRTYADGLRAIHERRHDVYLINYRLDGHTGLELLPAATAGDVSAPVIMLTGPQRPELDRVAAANGISDYLVKLELEPNGLERAIRYAIGHRRAVRAAVRSQERYALAVRAANDGIWDWDLITGEIYMSPRWHEILGRSRPLATGDPGAWFALVHPDDLPHLHAAIDAHLEAATEHMLAEYRMRHADGSWRWVMTRGLATRDADGVPTRMAGSLSDIDDRRVAQLRLQHDALHDALTGLPNRDLLLDRVSHALQRARRHPQGGCALLFLDVDRFKLVNDSLSHAAGDELLIQLSERLAAALRPGDTVARIGGDEFTLLLEDAADIEEARLVAARILAALDRPFRLAGHELFVSASIGIALSGPGLRPDDLIRNADIAMYDAKRRGRARCTVFDDSMRRRVVMRLARENELRQVVECSLLGIAYQPIVDLQSGSICGLEALARWPADRSPVAPAEFISIAEETGVIGALGRHVLETALETLAGWRREGLIADDVCMSVNLSGRQLDDPGLAEQVRTAISSASLPPQALKLEITESTLMHEVERTQHVFSEVCAGGVGLHLDDFGTGYSSLTALHQFPVDALKIDRSFVATMSDGAESSDVIVRSTVALAHSLGLPVIAEGIEQPDQLRQLRALGCEFGQGHLFSPALSTADTRSLLAGWDPERVLALA
jgi:diguanylate cyclase (GGDEF)-like protein/PAS domain S-box-containing protein